ncbi:MAG TPA: tetratricopeptide repeat protein [Actinomycetota bacterium]
MLAGYRQVLGEEHPYTLTSVSSLASVHQALGDLDVARTLHEQALAGRRQVLGDDRPDTLQSMNNLAAIRQELGEL